MREINSKIRVRKSVYQPSSEIKKHLGEEGTILKYLGQREDIINEDITTIREVYLVKFKNDTVEMIEDMFDNRFLR